MKCKWKGANMHRTRDSVSPGAIETLKVAEFPPTYSAVCECQLSGGTVSEADCSSLTVFDETGAACAHFIGAKYRQDMGEDGLIVFAMPTEQANHTDNDSIGSVISAAKTGSGMGEKVAQGGVPGVTDVPTQDRTPITVDTRNRLAEINQKNQSFWAKRAGVT
jgi:hypothetical protein